LVDLVISICGRCPGFAVIRENRRLRGSLAGFHIGAPDPALRPGKKGHPWTCLKDKTMRTWTAYRWGR
jgi:hypothetical protein